LDISVGTVKSRILRGRRMLKDILYPLLRAPVAESGDRTSNQSEQPKPSRAEDFRSTSKGEYSGAPPQVLKEHGV
jgi:hypothetical protein